VRYQVEIDGVRHEASSVIVTRSRHYAGPYVVAPNAALGKPLLHVCLFERWGARTLSASAWRCCSAACRAWLVTASSRAARCRSRC